MLLLAGLLAGPCLIAGAQGPQDSAETSLLSIAQDKSTLESQIADSILKAHGEKAERKYATAGRRNLYLVYPCKPKGCPELQILVDTTATARGSVSGRVMAQAVVVKAYHELGEAARRPEARRRILELNNQWNNRRLFVTISVDAYGYLLLRGDTNIPSPPGAVHPQVVWDLIVRVRSAWSRYYPLLAAALARAGAAEALIRVPEKAAKTALAGRDATTRFLRVSLPSMKEDAIGKWTGEFWGKAGDFSVAYESEPDRCVAVLWQLDGQRSGILLHKSPQGFLVLPRSLVAGLLAPTGVQEAAKGRWYEQIARRLAVRGTCTALAVFADGSAMRCTFQLKKDTPGAVFYKYEKVPQPGAAEAKLDVRLKVGGLTVKGTGGATEGKRPLAELVE
jgi:hypothetical protein